MGPKHKPLQRGDNYTALAYNIPRLLPEAEKNNLISYMAPKSKKETEVSENDRPHEAPIATPLAPAANQVLPGTANRM